MYVFDFITWRKPPSKTFMFWNPWHLWKVNWIVFVLANCDEGEKLRTELKEPLKHIRLCSLSPEEFCSEVAPTNVLRSEEVLAVCVSTGTKKKQPEVTEICNEVEIRRVKSRKSPVFQKVWRLTSNKSGSQCFFTIKTKNSAIEMLSLMIDTEYLPPEHNIRHFDIYMQEVDRLETIISIPFCVHKLYGDLRIPISTQKKEVILLANSEYRVRIHCSQGFTSFSTISTEPTTEHFTITYLNDSFGFFNKCIKRIEYRTVVQWVWTLEKLETADKVCTILTNTLKSRYFWELKTMSLPRLSFYIFR